MASARLRKKSESLQSMGAHHSVDAHHSVTQRCDVGHELSCTTVAADRSTDTYPSSVSSAECSISSAPSISMASSNSSQVLSTQVPAASWPQVLVTSAFGSHAMILKGEDGLRVERLVIGGDVVVCAVVADGHGGHQAAALVLHHMCEMLCEESHGNGSSIALAQALERTFARLHAMLVADQEHTAGTVVTVCLLNETRGELTTGHVGDVTAILVPSEPEPNTREHAVISLTSEHRLAESVDERHRVLALGGKVGYITIGGKPSGPLRGFPGGVCCARAIGDRDCGPWLSPVPDIKVMPCPDGACVLIASDGVWDAIPRETAVKLALMAKDVYHAAERIVHKALKARGARDDITCVCLVFSRNRFEDSGGGSVDLSRQLSDEGGGVDGSAASLPMRAPSIPSPPSVRRASLMSQFASSALHMRPGAAAGQKLKDTSVKGGMLFSSIASPQSLMSPVNPVAVRLEENEVAASAAASAAALARSPPRRNSEETPSCASWPTLEMIPDELIEEGLAQQLSPVALSDKPAFHAAHAVQGDSSVHSITSTSSSEGDWPAHPSPPQLFAYLHQQPQMQLRPRTLPQDPSNETSDDARTDHGVGILRAFT